MSFKQKENGIFFAKQATSYVYASEELRGWDMLKCYYSISNKNIASVTIELADYSLILSVLKFCAVYKPQPSNFNRKSLGTLRNHGRNALVHHNFELSLNDYTVAVRALEEVCKNYQQIPLFEQAKNISARWTDKLEVFFANEGLLGDLKSKVDDIESRTVNHEKKIHTLDQRVSTLEAGNSVITPHVQNTVNPVRNYQNRPELQIELSRALESHNFVVISGLGGMEKTQLVKKFASVGVHHRDITWMFDGRSKEQLKSGYEQLAGVLKISISPTDTLVKIVENLHTTLLNSQKSVLFIYDNVADEASFNVMLGDNFSSFREDQQVIVTSRNPNWDFVSGMPPIAVGKFKHVEALEYLSASFAGIKTKVLDSNSFESDCEALINRLQAHPLGLAQAVCYVITQKISIRHFIDIFQEVWDTKITKLTAGYDFTVFTIVTMCLDAIKDMAQRDGGNLNAQNAFNLLHRIALLDNYSIPKTVLTDFSEPDFDCQSILICENLGIITLASENNNNNSDDLSYEKHSLSAEVIRALMISMPDLSLLITSIQQLDSFFLDIYNVKCFDRSHVPYLPTHTNSVRYRRDLFEHAKHFLTFTVSLLRHRKLTDYTLMQLGAECARGTGAHAEILDLHSLAIHFYEFEQTLTDAQSQSISAQSICATVRVQMKTESCDLEGLVTMLKGKMFTRPLPSSVDLSHYYECLGELLMNQNKLETAVKTLKVAFNFAVQNSDVVMQTSILYLQGNCLAKEKKFKEAKDIFQQCWDITPDSEREKFYVAHQIGIMHLSLDKSLEALHWMKEATRLAENRPNDSVIQIDLTKLYYDLGQAQKLAGDSTEALIMAEKALTCYNNTYRKDSSSLLKPSIQQLVGVLLLELSKRKVTAEADLERAKILLLKSKERFITAKSIIEAMACIPHLAEISKRRMQFEKAITYWREIESMANQVPQDPCAVIFSGQAKKEILELQLYL